MSPCPCRVGFGNLSPTSPRSRLFTTCFAMTGILIDALAVSEVRCPQAHRHTLEILTGDVQTHHGDVHTGPLPSQSDLSYSQSRRHLIYVPHARVSTCSRAHMPYSRTGAWILCVWVWCVQLLSYVQEQHYQHMQEWNRSFANALATTVGGSPTPCSQDLGVVVVTPCRGLPAACTMGARDTQLSLYMKGRALACECAAD